jgi:hypothetical protein
MNRLADASWPLAGRARDRRPAGLGLDQVTQNRQFASSSVLQAGHCRWSGRVRSGAERDDEYPATAAGNGSRGPSGRDERICVHAGGGVQASWSALPRCHRVRRRAAVADSVSTPGAAIRHFTTRS